MGKENEVQLFKKVKEIIQTKPRLDDRIYALLMFGFFIFRDYWTRPQSRT